MAVLTIVFADLTGSTGLFEALGNARAAELVTRTTHWIGKLFQARGGRVIKYLGDGVLASFTDNQAAVLAMVEMQRLQRERSSSRPSTRRASSARPTAPSTTSSPARPTAATPASAAWTCR